MPHMRPVMGGSIYFYKYNLSRLISGLYLRELTIGRVKEMSMNSVNMPRIFSELFLPQDVGEATCRWSLPEALKNKKYKQNTAKREMWLLSGDCTEDPDWKPSSFVFRTPWHCLYLFGICVPRSTCGREELPRIVSGHPYSPWQLLSASLLILGTYQAAPFFQFFQQTFLEHLMYPKS